MKCRSLAGLRLLLLLDKLNIEPIFTRATLLARAQGDSRFVNEKSNSEKKLIKRSTLN